MTLQKTEVTKFSKGVISSASEEDLNTDIATFSLNIDAEREVFALRGIKGDYILGEGGWQVPRYSKWQILVSTNVVSSLNKKVMVVYAYDKTFALLFSTMSDELADDNYEVGDKAIIEAANWTPIKVDLSAIDTTVNDDKGAIADAIKAALDTCVPDATLSSLTGETKYFTSTRGGEGEGDNGSLTVRSLFLGNLSVPFAPQDVTGKITIAENGSSNITLPDSTIYGDFSTKFISGTGLSFSEDSIADSYNFSFLKSYNIKGNSNIFGITKDNKARLFQNIGNHEGSSEYTLGSISTSSNENEISAEQRNTNLYIGTGGAEENQGLWLGEIDRKQLNITFSSEMILTKNKLDSIPPELGPSKLNNLVVPTLHHGLNSTNGGIAGSASIYAETSVSGADVTNNSYSNDYIRSVNSWAARCLINADAEASNYSHFSLGMIFRLDLYGAHVAGSSPASINDTPTGTSAYTYLRDVKQFAKGDFQLKDITSDTTNSGADGEALHSGDLFQIVHVPADGSLSNDSVEQETSMIRFSYVGVLTGDYGVGNNENSHDSKTAYMGFPAYTFGHFNDDKFLHRVRTTGKSAENVSASENYVYNSSGTQISFDRKMVDSVNLEEEMGLANFKIGSMAECKSCDGDGGFGGGFGKELISDIENRDFQEASNWGDSGTTANKWSQDGGTYNEAATSGATEGEYFTDNYLKLVATSDSDVRQAILDGEYFEEASMITGETYRLSYSIQIEARTSGTLSVGFANESHAIDTNSDKTYEVTKPAATDYFDFVYDGTANHAEIVIQASTTSVFEVYFDNFSLKKVSKNYHMGYGKLWVSDISNYDKLYLVDITNWDNIDVDRPRISFKTVELDFTRIHNHLFNKDDYTYGNGLLRLWYGHYGEDDFTDLVNGYNWEAKPKFQYISSICETYSHKPHLGDESEDTNGGGKWRVWVNYSKSENLTHDRWDLFLFNFRPQAWGADSSTNDRQSGLGDTNTVYMFDKTPPYQECAYYDIHPEGHGDTNDVRRIYYPYDKFAIAKDEPGSDRSKQIITDSDGDYTEKAKGGNYIGKRSAGYRRVPFSKIGLQSNNLNFRNPSGEYQIWHSMHGSSFGRHYNTEHSSGASPRYFFFMGKNIGWSQKKPRKWINVRHCLKPYYKKWYFTGNGYDKSDISQTELGAPVAHIVSFFGKLAGDFITDGGTVRCAVDKGTGNSGDAGWYGYKDGVVEEYIDDLTMFTMHDSPVAFSTLSSGETNLRSADFNKGETQGASSNTVLVNSTYTNLEGITNQKAFTDTEAGFKVDKSVPATMGYSRYNQYRYHHDYNGGKQINRDTGQDNEGVTRPGYGSDGDGDDGKGGAYYGQDGFGHYNMVTTTWASNQDILNDTDTAQTYENDQTTGNGATLKALGRWRVFGNHGADTYRKGIERTAEGAIKGTNAHDNIDSGSINMKFGTGYCTYGWPGFNATDDIDPQGGYYSSSDNVDLDGDGSNSGDFGSKWENRKTIHCWSTTALTDSVYINTTHNNSNKTKDGDWKVYKSPRCSFRRIETPAGWEFTNLVSVDMISWQKPTTTTNGEINTGYLLQGPLSKSDYSNNDNSMTGMMVINPKVSDKNVKEKIGQTPPDDAGRIVACQAKAAVAPVSALLKQHRINSEEWSYAIAAYKNDFLMSKNLVPGLADRESVASAVYNRKWKNDGDGSDNNFGRFLDIYSPMIIGNQGEGDKEIIANWIRPQFKDGDANITDLTLGSEFPYYVCDKLYNFWATDTRVGDTDDDGDNNVSNVFGIAGFDRSIKYASDSQDDGTDSDLQPTEGWGSSAGSSKFAFNDDGYYKSITNNDEYIEGGNIETGTHLKIKKNALLGVESEEEIQEGGVGEFKVGTIWYNFTYLYDGFQEGPLSVNFPYEVKAESQYLRLKIKLSSAQELGLNPRITHINIYRKNSIDDLFRLVKSIALDMKTDKFELVDNEYTMRFNDDLLMSTYESLNGVPESLTNFTPNYKLSCQLNDFLFVSGIGHPEISQEGEHMIFRSKQGKFSIFNWSTDFIDLPTKPIALVAFAGRIFVFDENNVYKINPEGLYIEDVSEGVGILNNKSVITTDIGMFFCDRNNIYIHNGKNIKSIGGPILYNQSKPEWQIGYLDAINRAEALGYTPRLGYDPSKKSIYVVLQGYNESFSSYEKHKTRIYSFNIEQKRWDYYSSPNVTALTTTSKGSVVMADGYQVYNYNVDKRNRKAFQWESVPFNMGSTNYDKAFKSLKISGELCLYKFNNINQSTQQEASLDDGGQDEDDFNGNADTPDPIDWRVGDGTHILELDDASEDDDLKVYVDNVLQTMRMQTRKPNIGHYIGNDTSGSIYNIMTELPAFNSSNNGLLDYEGNTLTDAFSLNLDTLPEFKAWPTGQFKETTKQGGIEELIYIHKGMHLYFSGKKDNGAIIEEIVKVRNILFFWNQDPEGVNEIVTNPQESGYNKDAVTVRVWRGQLGTKAIDWNAEDGLTVMNNIRVVTPKFKYPKGAKGRDTKVVFQNQKSSIDSFAITYRAKKFK